MLRGREHECREIRELLDRPAGGALLLHGEPGAGRSALLAYAQRHAGGRALLAATGLPDEATLPFAGLQRLLDPVLDRAAALPGRQRQVLRCALAGEGCPEEDRLALSTAVLGLLTAVARNRPLLCTVDDLDLGDPPTARTLAFVARRLHHLPVTILLSAGSDTGVAGIRTHRLLPLEDRDSRSLLADRRPGPQPPAPVLAALTAIAAGNPQALADLADALTPAQWQGQEPLPGAPPPDGALARAYRSLLGRLPDDARRALLLAALAADLDADTLVRAIRSAGSSVEALAPAEAAGVVRVDAQGGVVFGRPLVRDMVGAAASRTELRAVHLLLADVLDAAGQRLPRALHRAAAADGPDPLLATELEAATADGVDDWATAATALTRAADLSDDPSLAVTRRVTAARYAWFAGDPDRARALLHAVAPAPVEPSTGAPPPSAQPAVTSVVGHADLLRGEMRLRCGAPPAALPTLLAAATALAETDRGSAMVALVRAGEAVCFSGEQYRYAEVARRMAALRRDGDPPQAQLMSTLVGGVAATLRGEHTGAGPLLRRAVVLGGRLTGAALTPTALSGAAVAGLLVAVDAPAHRLADRAVELARDRGELSLLPRTLELRAMTEYWLGRHATAIQSCQEGLRVARAGGQHTCAAVHLGLLAVLAAVRAERDTSLRYVAEMGEAVTPDSRPYALAQWALAVLDLVDARYADAADRLAALARAGTGRGQVLVQVMATPHLVEAATHDGRPAQARAALAVFDRWVGSTASPSRRALSARCHALLAPRGSAEADKQFRAALRLHPAGATFERARTELLFGRELRRSRRPRDARDYLHRARQTFTLLGAQLWAEQATTELRAAGESVGAPDRPAARLLTGQQLHIAYLVASGATNREIATAMFLSTRTVDHHLRNIFHRLGIRSRTELARVLG
ncbi:helix-turn-helix transcriptional regulator [Micromonospora phaseoli]|nr:helix-turn-helix transcriptional regulator [Micromonospora phaseoli]